MFQRILRRMRERIRKRQYVMTLHAEEEMNGFATFGLWPSKITCLGKGVP